MIPRSTTLTTEGRAIRSRLLWAGAASLVVIGALFAIALFDRSTVVDGAGGSTFVTTATGLAALHDTLDRAGRDVARLQRPLGPGTLSGRDTYVVADVTFRGYERVERDELARHLSDGGRIVAFGRPPDDIVDEFDIDIGWRSGTAGSVVTVDGDELVFDRFGSFDPGHDGTVVATGDGGDAVVSFDVARGTVVLVADSAVAHNATVDRADHIVFLDDVLGGAIVFDEFRHGYDDTPDTGLITAAPGNWPGALAVGAIAVVVSLATYGRRFGPVEPAARDLVPGRGVFIDSVARSLRRADGPIPTGELRLALTRELNLAPDSADDDVRRRLTELGVDDDIEPDRALAAVLTRKANP